MVESLPRSLVFRVGKSEIENMYCVFRLKNAITEPAESHGKCS